MLKQFLKALYLILYSEVQHYRRLTPLLHSSSLPCSALQEAYTPSVQKQPFIFSITGGLHPFCTAVAFHVQHYRRLTPLLYRSSLLFSALQEAYTPSVQQQSFIFSITGGLHPFCTAVAFYFQHYRRLTPLLYSRSLPFSALQEAYTPSVQQQSFIFSITEGLQPFCTAVAFHFQHYRRLTSRLYSSGLLCSVLQKAYTPSVQQQPSIFSITGGLHPFCTAEAFHVQHYRRLTPLLYSSRLSFSAFWRLTPLCTAVAFHVQHYRRLTPLLYSSSLSFSALQEAYTPSVQQKSFIFSIT